MSRQADGVCASGRLKELLDKRTAKNKELQREVEERGGGSGGDEKVRDLQAKLTESKRQRKQMQSKQETLERSLSESETRSAIARMPQPGTSQHSFATGCVLADCWSWRRITAR